MRGEKCSEIIWRVRRCLQCVAINQREAFVDNLQHNRANREHSKFMLRVWKGDKQVTVMFGKYSCLFYHTTISRNRMLKINYVHLFRTNESTLSHFAASDGCSSPPLFEKVGGLFFRLQYKLTDNVVALSQFLNLTNTRFRLINKLQYLVLFALYGANRNIPCWSTPTCWSTPPSSRHTARVARGPQSSCEPFDSWPTVLYERGKKLQTSQKKRHAIRCRRDV